MVLPQRDPGPAGGIPSASDTGAQSGAAAAAQFGLRRNRGDKSMLGKGVRIKFPQQGDLFHFPVNPESVTLDFPTRIAVTQTLASPYFDSFGNGIGSGQMAGTCGWGVPLSDPLHGVSGLTKVLELKTLYHQWQNETVQRIGVRQTTCDIILDFSLQMFQVVFNNLRLEQSKDNPMIVRYTLSWQILEDYNAPLVVLPLSQLDQAGMPPNDGGSPIVQPGGIR